PQHPSPHASTRNEGYTPCVRILPSPARSSETGTSLTQPTLFSADWLLRLPPFFVVSTSPPLLPTWTAAISASSATRTTSPAPARSLSRRMPPATPATREGSKPHPPRNCLRRTLSAP